MYRLRGLGAGQNIGGSIIDTGLGTTADCSQWGPWLLNSGCWKYSPGAWQQIGALPSPPAPAPIPAVSAGVSTVPAPYQCASGSMVTAASNCPEYQAAIDAAIGQQQAAQSANLAAFSAVLPSNPIPPAGCNFLQSETTDADGNPVCSYSWTLYAVIAVVGVIGLAAIGGGGPRRYGR